MKREECIFLILISIRVTKNIAESSRIQTMKFFERESIKQMLIKEREQVLFPTLTLKRNSKTIDHSARSLRNKSNLTLSIKTYLI